MEFFIKGVGKPVRVYLQQRGDDVNVLGEDYNGRSWILFTLLEDGRFRRIRCIDETVGIAVDNLGRIKEKE